MGTYMAAVLSCLGKPGRLRQSAFSSASMTATGVPWWRLLVSVVEPRNSSTVMLSQDCVWARRHNLGLGIFLVGTRKPRLGNRQIIGLGKLQSTDRALAGLGLCHCAAHRRITPNPAPLAWVSPSTSVQMPPMFTSKSPIPGSIAVCKVTR